MATVTRSKEHVKQVPQEDGTVEEERSPVTVFVHCVNEDCGLYHNLDEGMDNEREVAGVREETTHAYVDRGGDLPGPENSHVKWLCQDVDDTVCPECGLEVNVSEHKAPQFPRKQFAPGEGLKGAEKIAALAAAKAAESGQAQQAVADAEVSELRKQVTKLAELVKDQPDEAA